MNQGAYARTRSPRQPATTIGALAPMTSPGWVEAGRHLLAGMELAASDVNREGGIEGQLLEIMVRDTAAKAERAAAAVAELAGLGIRALAGEYHSVAARAAARQAEALAIPFLCSSAVIDVLVEGPSNWVARITPPQSRSWPFFAQILAKQGHCEALILADPGPYWSSGSALLAGELARASIRVREVAAPGRSPREIASLLRKSKATLLVLLVGHPDPGVSIVRALRSDPGFARLAIAAPAGQPEWSDWRAALGPAGAGIPFLSYMPKRLTPLGRRAWHRLRQQLGEEPSFVAFEGYDTIIALTAALRAQHRPFWSGVSAGATRGPLSFTQSRASGIWQCDGSPVTVVERESSNALRLLARQ